MRAIYVAAARGRRCASFHAPDPRTLDPPLRLAQPSIEAFRRVLINLSGHKNSNPEETWRLSTQRSTARFRRSSAQPKWPSFWIRNGCKTGSAKMKRPSFNRATCFFYQRSIQTEIRQSRTRAARPASSRLSTAIRWFFPASMATACSIRWEMSLARAGSDCCSSTSRRPTASVCRGRRGSIGTVR
ncbi:protein of unknown function [Methylocella tundrae]|uniref:Uncharacterized protein n=1 Tax=Methylocella tundrae TaxID=227605 RepID=A0A4U8Z2F6_METTU|nr:protein of unknown function [Methylocella tundrae]